MDLLKTSSDPHALKFTESVVTHEMLLELERFRSQENLPKTALVNWLQSLAFREDSYDVQVLIKDINKIKERKLQLYKSKARKPRL